MMILCCYFFRVVDADIAGIMLHVVVGWCVCVWGNARKELFDSTTTAIS